LTDLVGRATFVPCPDVKAVHPVKPSEEVNMQRWVGIAFAALCLMGVNSLGAADDAMKADIDKMKADMKMEKDAIKADMKAKKTEMKERKKAQKEKMKAKKEAMKAKGKARRDAIKAKSDEHQDAMKAAGDEIKAIPPSVPEPAPAPPTGN
jgi:phenylalanyl-tRNA synthetase alpha subunit